MRHILKLCSLTTEQNRWIHRIKSCYLENQSLRIFTAGLNILFKITFQNMEVQQTF